MARIVLNPFGSLGDLHPYLALAWGLRERGHQVTIATSAVYRPKVQGDGFEFAAVRPDAGELMDKPGLMNKLLDARRGTEFLLRDYLIPQVRAGFDDLMPVCRKADLLLTHMASFAGPVVADTLRMPWISVALQPAALFSRFDLMTLPRAPWLRHFYRLGPWFTASLLRVANWETRRWAVPILDLRRDLGLQADRNPVMWGQYSPLRTLALFSRWFAPAQPDWPAGTVQPGFLFYDTLGLGMPGAEVQDRNLERLEQFINESSDPVVLFTLGSSAVMQPGDFYEESLAAIQKLGVRAILLAGKKGQTRFSKSAPDRALVLDYLPYSAVMPRVAVTVHAGGIGSTAQVLRAGCPSLVVPWSNDQPDNADRLARLGVGSVLPRRRYRASTAARELEKLLQTKTTQERARQIGGQIGKEDALEAACQFLSARTS